MVIIVYLYVLTILATFATGKIHPAFHEPERVWTSLKHIILLKKSGVENMKLTKISRVVLLTLIGFIFTISSAYPEDPLFDTPVNYLVGDNPTPVISADFDMDGDFDLAVANNGSDSVSILKNNGDGTFTAPVNYFSYDASYVFSADFDMDGDLDLAIANYSIDNVSILDNNGNGTFSTAGVYYVGPDPNSVISADFDSDGDYHSEK